MTTVALALVRELAVMVKAPRMLYLHWPFGHALGEPNKRDQQYTVLHDTFSMALCAPRPGLIYLDLEMPGMDGQATLKAIKADPQLRDIPVVMMTGVCDEKEMKTAAANGANSYTLKPANVEQFLRTVLASTSYWLTIHQYPDHHVAADSCRR